MLKSEQEVLYWLREAEKKIRPLVEARFTAAFDTYAAIENAMEALTGRRRQSEFKPKRGKRSVSWLRRCVLDHFS